MSKIKWLYVGIIAVFLTGNLLGCTFVLQKGRRSDLEKIETLNNQLDQLSVTKKLLEERLKQEIADKQVRLTMADKGLVITFVAEILFDSGKSKIRPQAFPVLDKVAMVLNENVPDMQIGIEGHTDTQPIKYSGWPSNWELSGARAMSVLHYLVDEKGLDPARVSATGYGQYNPVASNDTEDGRQLNRRVEVVILPQLTKARSEQKKKPEVVKPQEENLK